MRRPGHVCFDKHEYQKSFQELGVRSRGVIEVTPQGGLRGSGPVDATVRKDFLKRSGNSFGGELKAQRLHAELTQGRKLLDQAAKKDRELLPLVGKMETMMGNPQALTDAICALSLPALLVFQSAYEETTNTKARAEAMRGILFDAPTRALLDSKIVMYENIKELMTTAAQFTYEKTFAGSHKSRKNTLPDFVDARVNELGGVNDQLIRMQAGWEGKPACFFFRKEPARPLLFLKRTSPPASFSEKNQPALLRRTPSRRTAAAASSPECRPPSACGRQRS
jgi:hypothetical protein